MGVVFRFGTHRLLARILPWVYRSYHRHGVDFAYFPLELHAWQRSIRDQLGEESMAEILRIYDWMIASHERIIQLSDLPSPFGPLPSEYQWQDFAECLLAGDWRRALALTDAHEAPDRRIDFFEHAVRNSMYDIGCRWEDGQVSVAYEHLATASVARLLSALPPTLPPAGQKKGKAIVTATDNEFHEMGAWLVADALEADGWTVRFLGANTPRQELMDMVSLDTPDILLLSATMPPNLRHVEGTIRSIRQLPGCADLPVLVGGLAFAEEPDLYRRVGADATAADCRGAVQQARLCWGGGNAEH
jgi:methanogenic corrinoid protein MtbC1